jgi:type I restriction enzyme R subunit
MPNQNSEQVARESIDAQLRAAGWMVQSLGELNLSASRGVTVREMQSHGGPADYILFVDGKALGVVEAKKEGTTLSAVAEQSASCVLRMIPISRLPQCDETVTCTVRQ